MPELPEVETIKLQLARFLVGHRIKKIEVRWKKTFKEGQEKLVGGKITAVRRFGKVLVFDLDNGYSALMHLKMTGQPLYRGPKLSSHKRLSQKVLGGIPGKHTHVIFYLDRGGEFYFNDVRKFGWIRVVKSEEGIANEKSIGNLGLEPLRDLTLEKFGTVVQSTARPIKIVLMDQTKIAGIGNIYANDALYLAKVHPQKRADKLNKKERKILYESINNVLKEGIKRKGSSEDYYVTPDGQEGHYQDFTLIYDKEGEICKKCKKEKIKKIKLGGRGTYYCPACQRLR